MHWGWLFNRFEDPGLTLTNDQRAQALRSSTRQIGHSLVGKTALFVVPPLFLALWGAKQIDAWVASQLGVTQTQAFFIMIGVVCLASWPWSAWVYGRMYMKPYRRALRELGVKVCVDCGYAMEDFTRCSECGWVSSDRPRE